jgi:thiamine biosynthesis lipoprotein
MMGTFVTITFFAPDGLSAEPAMDAAFSRIEHIEARASNFDETAEAWRLNQNGYLNNPSPELWQLVSLSLDYGRMTDGYFDITVQPLLDLWAGGLWQESPETQQTIIDETLSMVGWDKIGMETGRIYFKISGMQITLGGIAKGYAAEEALVVLENRGIKHALIDVGGDVSALGSKPQGKPWTIALVNPDDTSQSLASFSFSNKAVATSGNYARYFDPDKEIHHILNPRTGYSANECISVTIIAEDSTRADILATAVFAMGPEAGLKLIESLDNVECLIVDAQRTVHRSTGLTEYLVEG